MSLPRSLTPFVEYPKWIYRDPVKLSGGVIVANADEERSVLSAWLAEADDNLTQMEEMDAETDPSSPSDAMADDAPRKRGRPRKLTPDTPEE